MGGIPDAGVFLLGAGTPSKTPQKKQNENKQILGVLHGNTLLLEQSPFIKGGNQCFSRHMTGVFVKPPPVNKGININLLFYVMKCNGIVIFCSLDFNQRLWRTCLYVFPINILGR